MTTDTPPYVQDWYSFQLFMWAFCTFMLVGAILYAAIWQSLVMFGAAMYFAYRLGRSTIVRKPGVFP